MSSIHTVLIFALVTASFTPVYVLEFCLSTDSDCHTDDNMASDSVKSRWNMSFPNLIQDLDQFNMSCQKLIGKGDPCLHFLFKQKTINCKINPLSLSPDAFPVDEVNGNFIRTVKNCIFSRSIPTPLKGPLRLAAVSKVFFHIRSFMCLFYTRGID